MDNNRISIGTFKVQETSPLYVDIAGTTVEITPVPPVAKIIDAVQFALNMTITESPIISAPVKKIFCGLAEVMAFTNIDIELNTQDVNSVYNVYDVLNKAGVFSEIATKANKDSLKFLVSSFEETLDNIITYRQSAIGIVDTMATRGKEDADTMVAAAEAMMDDNNLTAVKQLLDMTDKLSTPQEIAGTARKVLPQDAPDMFMPVE